MKPKRATIPFRVCPNHGLVRTRDHILHRSYISVVLSVSQGVANEIWYLFFFFFVVLGSDRSIVDFRCR